MRNIHRPRILSHEWRALTVSEHRFVVRIIHLFIQLQSIPRGLVLADLYLTILYAILLRPPFENPIVEVPLVIGAALSTLIIWRTALDLAMSHSR